MKTIAISTSRYASYRRGTAKLFPGAERRRVRDMLLDAALAAGITMGVIVTILFLLVL